MQAYLDNAATTQTLPEVAERMVKVMTEDYGNPSSLHGKGFAAETILREAAQTIAGTLKVEEKSIVFTSGGTESNNHAIIGTALAYQREGKHIITTSVEHPSVLNTCRYLESMGFEITYLPVDERGLVRPEDLAEAIRKDTILVSVMTVNNEVGAVQDIPALVRTVREKKPDIRFHTDAVQAYAKLPILPKKWDVDLLSVSAHKFGGPKGIGFLYVKEGGKLHPLIHGGGQQKDRRSGTENVPAIAGMALAAEEACRDRESTFERLSGLKKEFIDAIRSIDGVAIHGNPENASPYIISVGIDGIKAEVLLHALEDREIYVSSGSACSSNHPGISGTLTAMGVEKTYHDSTIRFSLSRFTTKEELSYALDILRELIPSLRRFTKR